MALIEISHLTKTYGGNDIPALEDVNISLESGQIVGLLGTNGSGKTTLIKVLNGLLQSYEGEVLIDGQKPGPYTKSIVSYLPDVTYLQENQRVSDIILYFDDLFSDFDKDNMLDLLKTFRIKLNSRCKHLSKGNKEKLQLGLVLSRKAKVYLLDEPIGGVDPAARDFIIETILANYAKDSLVLISTHLIEDIESICNSVIMLKEGQVVLQGNCDQIRKEHENKTLNQIFKELFRC